MFNWNIEAVFVVPQEAGHTDVVTKVIWKCFAGDTANYSQSAACYGHMMFVLGDSFINFEDLTEEQILNWCFANGVNKAAVEAIVADCLNNKSDFPVERKPLPWKPD
jgi:hypothetical protein